MPRETDTSPGAHAPSHAATDAARSPPCAPTPGHQESRARHAHRAARPAPRGAVAPTTSPTRPSRQRVRHPARDAQVQRPGRPRRRSWSRAADGLLVRARTYTSRSGWARNGSMASSPRYGDSVTASAVEVAEQALGVALGGRADVAALRVEDAEDVGRDVAPDALERRPAGRAERLEEGDVDLDGHGLARPPPRSRRGRRPRSRHVRAPVRQVVGMRVDPEAERRAERLDARSKALERRRHPARASSTAGVAASDERARRPHRRSR